MKYIELKKQTLLLIILLSIIISTCKKEELVCGDFNIGEAYLMPESKDFIRQNIGKKYFEDSNGNKMTFVSQNYLYEGNSKSILRTRCISPNNFWVDWGDYVATDYAMLSLTDNKKFSFSYRVFVVSSGLPPDTLHYDIAAISNIADIYPVLIPISKRGIPSKKDLNLGNRFIGDTIILNKPFHSVSKNYYAVTFNFYLSQLIKYIDVKQTLVTDDVYFTPEQGVIAFKKDGKLWVLSQ
ncbi:MAG: hypothetical protein JNL70_23075 [Saprospiraceae bacterium]|nr:hypothetical protein [Saprospiraceae bacterium]